MACYHPLRAWRARSGEIKIGKELPDADQLNLPCGNCLGCRMARARAWTLRCHLEADKWDTSVWSTLTYADESLPPTLDKKHLQRWLKRFRKKMGPKRTIRFFAAGEYGERTQRPHYHAILFNGRETDKDAIEETWGYGHVQTYGLTPASIAYVVGYCNKKIGYLRHAAEERVDPTTGEVYRWQPPFIQMSRRPGIGGDARQHSESWRLFAVHNGTKTPVPRFLHEAWKTQATPEQVEALIYEKHQLALKRDNSEAAIRAAEKIAIRKQALQAENRKL